MSEHVTTTDDATRILLRRAWYWAQWGASVAAMLIIVSIVVRGTRHGPFSPDLDTIRGYAAVFLVGTLGAGLVSGLARLTIDLLRYRFAADPVRFLLKLENH